MNPVQLQNAARSIQAGKLNEAERILREAVRLDPRDFQALHLLGFTHLRKKEYAQAEQLIGKAILLNPSQADAHYNRGCALQEMAREAEAVEAFDKALLLNPAYTEAEFNRATALIRLRRYQEAEMAFANLLRRFPRDPEAWHNYAEAMNGLGLKEQAFEAYTQALTLAPNNVKTLGKRASAYAEARAFDSAIADYEKLLKIDPTYEYAQGNLLYARLNCCDWQHFDRQRQAVESGVKARKSITTPLEYVLLSHSPKNQRLCSELWLKKRIPIKPEPLWQGERYAHDRIRVAYISADFRNHAVSQLLAGVIENHDRKRFEIIGISLGHDDDSEMRRRLKATFDRFIDGDAMTDEAIARWMRENEIDIAVDLMIHTGHSRNGIFAYRAAPVQVNYLGFAGTSGASYMDYIVADATVIPEADRLHYSEKVVYLPNSFQPNDATRKAADDVPSRASQGLPENGFVFCSFNNSCKILPEIFDAWMRILKKTEGSVLWLPQYAPAQEANLRREAQARGIDPARIVFAQLVPTTEEYLSRLRLADLFLDTLPYNAHTTASNALWMGVPVLTRLGSTYAGRVAASLLEAVGLPELIAQSDEEYEALALRLSADAALLSGLKQRLAANRETSPLFDTLRYCRNLEAAFAAMAGKTVSGEAPSHITVTEPA
jgi:protein O-GlcNAc transferase